MKAFDIIKALDLKPLPEEGGFFRETYRAAEKTPRGERDLATAIYYLITPDEFSALHRIPQDEIFHFYLGDPVEMVQIDPDGHLTCFVLGPHLLKGESLQVVVPGSTWQGLRLVEGGEWALMGVSVAPGFEFRDFKKGEREYLLRHFPHLASEILRFTRGSPSPGPP